MLDYTMNIGVVAHAIQLALASVFLLTAIAGMLNVMTGRLSRIIDRGRQITETATLQGEQQAEEVQRQLKSLEHRRYLASAALLVCTVIAALFLEVLLPLKLRWLVGIVFTASTLALVVGLAYFLREVHLATRTVRIGARLRKAR
ncbi:MAG: DUF2721 domain-containing protein [Proteobacteria bacterium]|nr:DUF2721 domain-containing protein [Pseudomonadota bacterium]